MHVLARFAFLPLAAVAVVPVACGSNGQTAGPVGPTDASSTDGASMTDTGSALEASVLRGFHRAAHSLTDE